MSYDVAVGGIPTVVSMARFAPPREEFAVPDQLPQEGAGASAPSRLGSWKEIAEYLKVSVRTAQRWESQEGLPVRRHAHRERSTACAYTDELDGWLRQRSEPAGRPERKAPVPRQTPMRAKAAPSAKPAAADGPSLVVLPFVHMGDDPADEYFTDGLTEDLIHGLCHLHGLRVVARTSAFRFKGQAPDLRLIREELGVTWALEGSVRRKGRRMRITAQLVNLADGFHLWSKRYDRDSEDVFAVQDDVSDQIVSSLGDTLSARRQRPPGPRRPTNLDAYDLYLRGRSHWNRWSPDGLREAVSCFRRAVELDSEYAPAFVGLADAYTLLGFWLVERPADMWCAARKAVEQALRIAPDLGSAHLASGAVSALQDHDWVAAGAAIRRGIDANPGYGQGYDWLARFCLFPTQRLDEGLDALSLATQIDPLSPMVSCLLAWGYSHKREFDRAIAQANRTLELAPDYLEGYWARAFALDAIGQHDDALAALDHAERLAPGYPFTLAERARSLARLGRRKEARATLSRLTELSSGLYVSPVLLAWVYVELDDLESAIRQLEEAWRLRDPMVNYLRTDPVCDPLRPHARFEELLSEAGLTDKLDSAVHRVRQSRGASART